MWATPASPRGSGALELDVLGSEALEQTAPLPEEHRDDVDGNDDIPASTGPTTGP